MRHDEARQRETIPNASLSERLKRETTAEHEAIEASLTILMSPELRREDYVRIVARFFGYFEAFESTAFQVLTTPTLRMLFEDRRKTPTLEADLRALSLDDSAIARLPRFGDLKLADTADVLGTMYVAEGSTLGGQIISKQLERRLGLSDGIGYGYFRGAGPATMQRWREFKAVLDSSLSGADADRAIARAALTFQQLQSWLSQPLP